MDSFDPFVEWLGRPAGSPPSNHYELLGLPMFEPDIDLIVHEVDAFRIRIRRIRPGTHLAEWQSLLDRLEAAKICLSDPISKAAYDESIDTASHSLNVSHEPVVTSNSPDQEMMVPTPEVPLPEVPLPEGPQPDAPEPIVNSSSEFIEAPPVVEHPEVFRPAQQGSPEASFPRVRPTRRKSSGTWRSVRLLLVTMILLAFAIGLVYLKKQKDAQQAAAKPPSTEETGRTIDDLIPPPAQDLPAPQPSDEGPQPKSHLEKANETATPPPEEDKGTAIDPPPTSPEMANPTAAAPEPAMANQDPPSMAAVDPARQKAYNRAIASVRKALSERDLETATNQLNEAVSLAQTDEERAEANQLEILRAHVDAFWGSLLEQLPGLEPGSEVFVGETMAVVVETGHDFIILRVNGQNRRFSLHGMPHVLVTAMAQALFSKSANAKALRASFLIVEPDGDPKEARQLLQEASQGGVEVDELVDELNRAR